MILMELCNLVKCKLIQKNNTWRLDTQHRENYLDGRFGTVDLLIKVTCFVKNEGNIVKIKRS
jgi:hypothetical protein